MVAVPPVVLPGDAQEPGASGAAARVARAVDGQPGPHPGGAGEAGSPGRSRRSGHDLRRRFWPGAFRALRPGGSPRGASDAQSPIPGGAAFLPVPPGGEPGLGSRESRRGGAQARRRRGLPGSEHPVWCARHGRATRPPPGGLPEDGGRAGGGSRAFASSPSPSTHSNGRSSSTRLALCYEKLGDLPRARERNAEMLRLWAKADPDLPMLAEAKALQARLAAPPAVSR